MPRSAPPIEDQSSDRWRRLSAQIGDIKKQIVQDESLEFFTSGTDTEDVDRLGGVAGERSSPDGQEERDEMQEEGREVGEREDAETSGLLENEVRS